jgi:hypothetical protein
MLWRKRAQKCIGTYTQQTKNNLWNKKYIIQVLLFSLRVEEKLLLGLVHTCVCIDNVVRLGLGFPKVPEWLELSWCPPRWVLLGSILTGGLIPLVFFYYVPFPWHIATRNITQNLLLEFCISHAHDKKKCVGIYTFCSPLYLYKGDLHYLIAQNAPVHGVSFSLFYGGRGDNTGLFQVGPNCWIACYKLDTREPRQLHILGLDASHSAY